MMKRIIILALFICSFFIGSCCNHSSHNRTAELRDSLLVEYMAYAGLFYDSSFLDWKSFTDLQINQNQSDWGKEIDKLIDPTWRGCDAASVYWDRLQSAKICLHVKSLPLRAVATPRMLKELDAIEQAFDDAFIEMVSQEYYMRVFSDVFDEVFSKRVDDMTRALARERRR